MSALGISSNFQMNEAVKDHLIVTSKVLVMEVVVITTAVAAVALAYFSAPLLITGGALLYSGALVAYSASAVSWGTLALTQIAMGSLYITAGAAGAGGALGLLMGAGYSAVDKFNAFGPKYFPKKNDQRMFQRTGEDLQDVVKYVANSILCSGASSGMLAFLCGTSYPLALGCVALIPLAGGFLYLFALGSGDGRRY